MIFPEASLEFNNCLTKTWQNWGYNVGLIHTAGTGDMVWWARNDANAVRPRNLLSSFEIRKASIAIRQLSPGVGSFIISLSHHKDCREITVG